MYDWFDIIFTIFDVCVVIIYYQMFHINLASLRLWWFLICWIWKEKDRYDIFDTAKEITNCYEYVLLLLSIKYNQLATNFWSWLFVQCNSHRIVIYQFLNLNCTITSLYATCFTCQIIHFCNNTIIHVLVYQLWFCMWH